MGKEKAWNYFGELAESGMREVEQVEYVYAINRNGEERFMSKKFSNWRSVLEDLKRLEGEECCLKTISTGGVDWNRKKWFCEVKLCDGESCDGESCDC